jgi:hypothetical protein
MLRYLVPLLLLIAIANPSFAGEVWLFLKDGRVCLAEPNATEGKLPDGTPISFTKEEIQGQRTREQLDQAVDAMIVEIGQAKNLDAHAARFRVFKGAAVPRLLHHLESPTAVSRLSALYALQFCWSPQAVEPVTKLLNDSDHDVFKGALAAVANNMPSATLLMHLKKRADDKISSLPASYSNSSRSMSPSRRSSGCCEFYRMSRRALPRCRCSRTISRRN